MPSGSGEGSRGGQIVGHTRSGFPIYASHLTKSGLSAHHVLHDPAERGVRLGPMVVTHDRHGNRVDIGGGYSHKTVVRSARKLLGQLS